VTAGVPPANRMLIFGSVMLVTALTALDTTIANVALPHMAGSVSASQDQISWVLTSYIAASAICTPLTGWVSARIGRKQLFLIAVGGFIVCSALCGAAQNLPEIVIFRVLQGMFAAPLMPLSQALILDLFTLAERGPAMSVWGMGVLVAPIAGPVLGGWLTDEWSWRWVFYINLPIGILCLLGIWRFIPRAAPDRTRTLDLVGFLLLAIAIGALQLMLDRGQGQAWFESSEILTEAAIALGALWMTLVHALTRQNPFLPIAIFRDRTFVTASLMGVMVGVVVLSVSALLPTMLQSVYGYSVLSAGQITAPRGVGSIISMMIVGRLIGRVDTRALLLCGQAVFAFSFYSMSTFTLDTAASAFVMNGFIQGLGTGFVFLPLTTMAFATIPTDTRPDAASFYTLMRNMGGGAGISLMLALLANATIVARGALVEAYSTDDPLVVANLPAPLSVTEADGIIALSRQVDLQATMLGYTYVFHSMFLVLLMSMPLVLLMRVPDQKISVSDEVAFE
jgi:MFS transporter, DHA2 family, multidrug resistance protein